jgi:hypothetical protein
LIKRNSFDWGLIDWGLIDWGLIEWGLIEWGLIEQDLIERAWKAWLLNDGTVRSGHKMARQVAVKGKGRE